MKLKKTIAAIAAAALTASAISLAALAGAEEEHEHAVSSWTSISDTQHQGTCTGKIPDPDDNDQEIDCEEEVAEGHDFIYNYAGEKKHTISCSKCDFEKTVDCTEAAIDTAVPPTCTEAGKTAGKKCSVCEEVLEAIADVEATGHTAATTWTTDTTQHWKVCSKTGCGAVVGEKANHTLVDKSDNTGHYKECSVCDYKTTPTPHAAAANAAWLDDGANHYKECAVAGCGAKVESDAHAATGDTKKDATNHWGECTCGKVIDKTAHSGTTKMSATQHWTECDTCGWVTAAVNHDTDDEGACSVCGYEEDVTDDDDLDDYDDSGNTADTPATQPHQHTAANDWSKDDDNHWHACTANDGGKLDIAAHTYVEGVCSACGAQENSGGSEGGDEGDGDDDNQGGGDVVTTPADDPVTTPADDVVTTPASNDNAVVDDTDSSTESTSGSSASTGGAGAVEVSSPAQVAATRNPVLVVNAADTPVSADMLEAFTKNDDAKTLTLSYNSSLKIAIDKEDVNDTSADIDISVNTDDFLSAKEVKKLGATKVVQIDLEGEGKIEGVDKVTVKYRVGAKFAGKEVAVYEYVDGKLVKIGTGKVTANGFVNFKTDHFGQFVIAVE